ncbi:related to Putative lipase YDR444W [Hanseniaspora guilliermondii]|uniref:Related to Putative lipase YDR444W n=1 Tax=Hanseniaspora guilliermondii TaxID=56406 RepID=A0A1L0CYL8_9ASCO|nr:related to Putative lipase YDR444W [Hanseniaspora guilliermondii]
MKNKNSIETLNTSGASSNKSSSSNLFRKSSKRISLYFDRDELRCGDVSRYTITYKKSKTLDTSINKLYFKLKNKMDLLLAPVFYLGPYSIYSDCRPYSFDEFKDYKSDDVIQFNPDIKPYQSFKGILTLNDGSLMESQDSDFHYYQWTIDAISQLSIHDSASIPYTLDIYSEAEDFDNVITENFSVEKTNADELWNLAPTVSKSDQIHLIIVTHGIFSNIGGDMLFIRDKLHQRSLEVNKNVIIRGYSGNVGKSYKGIEFLGKRLANYIMDIIDKENAKYKKNDSMGISELSFIAHSLGGCVQSYALAYIHAKDPHFFINHHIKLNNFITMASPMLGTAVEMPSYANFALGMGGLGKTGRDLSLKHKDFTDFSINKKENKPVLELVAQSRIFDVFAHRTTYANTLHDGIVPLRTSALLYLDWRALDKLYKLFKSNNMSFKKQNLEKIDKTMDSEIPKVSNIENHKHKKSNTNSNTHFASVFYNQDENKGKNKRNKYQRLQTIDNSSSNTTLQASDEIPKETEEIHFQPPPKPSALIAAANLVFAKLPTQDYIHSVASRQTDVVLHDKVYKPQEIPKAHYENRPTWKKIIYPNDKKFRKEERIARYWHKDKDWRKVLVVLKGDAHNDIVVRRRFVNLYGAVAVQHLIDEHFS